tara:strand:- start:591 stop:872 length:282 start_codon:yes stop_codon:yes gene_type:complete
MTIKVVEIQRTAIDLFKKYWPCHGLPADLDLIMAAFDDGDLIDLELIDADDVQIEACEYEQTGALAALLRAAEQYASKRPTAPEMIDGGWIYK